MQHGPGAGMHATAQQHPDNCAHARMHAGPLPEAWGQMGMFRLPRTAYTWGTFDVRCGHMQAQLLAACEAGLRSPAE
jgi:hypothetical protein